jgi:hypothetical protein
LGTDQIADKAYVKWWIEQVAVPSGESLADYAELLSNVDAHRFVGDTKVPMLILAPRRLA